MHKIMMVDPSDATTWTITAMNSVSTPGFKNGDLFTTAQFNRPTGLFLDPVAQVLYVADKGNNAVRAFTESEYRKLAQSLP